MFVKANHLYYEDDTLKWRYQILLLLHPASQHLLLIDLRNYQLDEPPDFSGNHQGPILLTWINFNHIKDK